MASRSERQKEIAKLEKEIRKLDSKRGGTSDSDSEEERKRKKTKRSLLDDELAKYEKARGLKGKRDGKGRKTRDEGDVLAKMNAFKSKLKGTFMETDGDDDAEAGEATAEGEEGIEVDNDTGFLTHKLFFPKDNDEEVAKAEREYEVIDPRKRGARAKEEELARKRRMKPKDGGRGFRR